MDTDLYELLQNADPETLQRMFDALNSGEQMGLGHEMLQTPGAPGMRAGGTYVAASPLEHIATALSRIQGARMIDQGQKARSTGLQAYIDALRTKPKVDPYMNDDVARAQFANEYGSE